MRTSPSRARSTEASCVITNSTRSSSRRISALKRRRERTAVSGSQRLEPFETIPSKRIIVPDALTAEQTLDSIGMLNALFEQRSALARQAPAIFFFRGRHANHGTDPPLPARPGHQRPQQRLAVDRIGLGPPMPPGDFGATLANEKLGEVEGVSVSRETVRQIQIRLGLWRPKRRRAKKEDRVQQSALIA